MILVAACMVALVPPADAATIDPEPVLTGAPDQFLPVSSSEWFGWAQSQKGRTSRIRVRSISSGGGGTRVNAYEGYSFPGGLDDGSDKMIYQQVRKTEHGYVSDVMLYDIASRDYFLGPNEVN